MNIQNLINIDTLQLSRIYEYLSTSEFSTPNTTDSNLSLNRVAKKISYTNPNTIKQYISQADDRIKTAISKRKQYQANAPTLTDQALKRSKLKQLDKPIRKQIESYISEQERTKQTKLESKKASTVSPVLPRKLRQSTVIDAKRNNDEISPLI